jgi:hypothetical protein
MAVTVNAEWKSSHSVVPPVRMSDEDFERALVSGDEACWAFALDQVNSSTAELTNWEVA